jgi:hypothetical protein
MSDTDPTPARRRFTLEQAREVLPEVRRLTDEAQREFAATQKALALAGDDSRVRDLEARLNFIARGWADAIAHLGAEAKGLWLVDFDNGAGYYCWRFPEAEVDHFHGYEEGFAGRMRIN